MCTVKPYCILNKRFRTFCRKASLPFPGEWTWGCGITFDIFTHVYYTGRLNFIKIYTNVKTRQVGDLGDGYNVVTCLKERRTCKSYHNMKPFYEKIHTQ